MLQKRGLHCKLSSASLAASTAGIEGKTTEHTILENIWMHVHHLLEKRCETADVY